MSFFLPLNSTALLCIFSEILPSHKLVMILDRNLVHLQCIIMGRLLINKKTCIYFLDEMSLAAAQLVHLSRLKIKTRLFVDPELPHLSRTPKGLPTFYIWPTGRRTDCLFSQEVM